MHKLLLLPSSPSSPGASSLRLPANKRIGTPVSQRLTSITDSDPALTRNAEASGTTIDSEATDAAEAATVTPRRRSLARTRLPILRRISGTSSKVSHPAPPYDWVPEPIDDKHDGRIPVEGENLRQLRNEDDEGRTVLWWKRTRVVVLVFVVVLLIALAVGLGARLSHGGKRGRGKDAVGAGNRTEAPLEFPLGRWTAGATLVEAAAGCTSNPSIWRCYPYTIVGEATFDLTVTNTSALYAHNNTGTADAGPANLTISSSNPFAIPFTNQSLTYIASPSNRSAERFEWSFEMVKSVIPSSSMMHNGAAAECAFPGAAFEGTLYLNAAKTGLDGMGGRDEWPYAVEIRQSVEGGGEAVECRGMTGGSVSVPAADGTCACVYRNY